MRFRPSDSPPPYLNKRDQMRMLAMIGLLALVIVAMKWASRPESWHWIVPPDPAQQARPDAQREIDFAVRVEESGSLREDEFRSPADPQDDSRAGEDAIPEDAPARARKPEEMAETADSAGDSVAIDPSLLEEIQDNTLGIRRSEAKAYYAVLRQVRSVPPEQLAAAALGNVDFRVLMTDSEAFRGQPLVVRGEVRRLLPLQADEDAHGIGKLYEAWLFTRDSGTNPYRVVAHQLTPNMPTGELTSQPVPVEVTGYFFKRQGYAAQKGLHTAPLLLAREIRWLKPAAAMPERSNPAPYIVAAVVATALVLGLASWRMSVGDRRFYQRQIKRIIEAPSESIEALSNVETADPNDLFRRLSEDSRGTHDAP